MATLDHVEETSWVLRVEASARFPEDYDGDEDGFAWRERFRAELLPRLAAAVIRELGNAPGWRAHAASRGLPSEDELVVRVERVLPTE
jgi:hypothetical protein